MNVWISDTETTPILRDDSTEKMWIIGGKNLATGEVVRFFPFQGKDQVKKAIDWASSVDTWIGHNFLAFDTPQINTHLGQKVVDPTKVIDTLVLSRLVYYDRPIPPGGDSAHSLKSWGIRLGCHKGDFHSFNSYSQEMLEYWEQDLEVNHKLYLYLKRFLDDPEWQRSIRVEHDTQIELIRQKFYGFRFNKPKAESLLKDILSEKVTLEKKIEESFPPQLKLVNTVQHRTKKDGSDFATVTKAKEKYALTKVNGDMLDCYDYVPFNPGSPVDRIDALWDAKWKPFEKTKTHQKFGRLKPGDPYGKSVESMSEEFYDSKKKHFERYGWVVNEDNLSTLPDTAPEGARLLAQWLTLEGRRSSLVEWLGQVRADSRIHGTTNHIGAWTGRGSHNNPNTANISSVWNPRQEPRSSVEEVKSRYDTRMRELWEAPEGSWLVGVDAEGIQLRILGDYLWRYFDKPDYAKTISEGKKEDETDIHNVNRRALCLEHTTRDDAKTFNIGRLR